VEQIVHFRLTGERGEAVAPLCRRPRTLDSDGAGSSELPAAAMNSELLTGLIAQANQEGSVTVETVDRALPAADSVKQAFLQYFQPLGLNVDVQFVGGSQTPDWESARTAINSGSAPQIDLLLGNATPQVYPFISITAPIDNGQELLKAVNPDAASGLSNIADYSPAPFTGRALLFCDYYDALVYSTQVNLDSLPNNLSDFADPKYNGRLAVPAYGLYKFIPLLLVYCKDEALQMAKGIGANSAGVESSLRNSGHSCPQYRLPSGCDRQPHYPEGVECRHTLGLQVVHGRYKVRAAVLYCTAEFRAPRCRDAVRAVVNNRRSAHVLRADPCLAESPHGPYGERRSRQDDART
jgi:hypothetical protein